MSNAETRFPADEFLDLIHGEMASYGPFEFTVEEMSQGYLRLRLHYCEGLLRPGGTVSGPSLFTLADATLYGVVLSVAGRSVMAVTTDVAIHFLRKPGRADVIAEGRLVKDDGRLVFGTVHIYSDGDPRPVAHASGSYAVPRGAMAPRDPAAGAV